jgi:hypothetical protein
MERWRPEGHCPVKTQTVAGARAAAVLEHDCGGKPDGARAGADGGFGGGAGTDGLVFGQEFDVAGV